FAGWIGADAQAGLVIAGTILFVLLALGFGVGSGVNALIGTALGEGDRKRASVFAGQALIFTVLIGVPATALGYAAAPYMLDLLGAEGPYRAAARTMIDIQLLATTPFLLAYAANGICASQGDTASFERALIGGFFANCALNPFFVVYLDWGVAGLAWATVIAQSGMALYMLHRATASTVGRGCGAAAFTPRREPIARIAAQGLPASGTMLMVTAGMFWVQVWLSRFGADAVAGYGVALRIEQMVLLPGFGITGALLPIVARNAGAGRPERVREALALALKLGVGLMIAAGVLITLLGRTAIALFIDDPAVVEMGWSYLSFARWMLPAYFALFAVTAFLQGLKRPLWAMWIGVYRQLIAVAVFGWLFVEAWSLGVEGVWWAILAAVFSGLALSAAVAARVGGRALAAA
ncbi:MAG: MATE family efflux transporter, partial [Pseudomonadota bacterium]